MKRAIIAAVAALVVFLPAPDARATPDCKHAGACQPGPYNGPLMPDWETYPYGGNSGAVQCNTISSSCGPIAVDPNGRR